MAIDPAMLSGMAPGGAAASNQQAPGQVPQAVQPGGAPLPPGAFQQADPAALAAAMQQAGGQGQDQQKKALVPASLARHIATMFNDRKKSMAKFMADSFGLPRGIVDADEETLVRAWLKRDKGFDVTQARLEGMAEDDIADKAYPLRRPLVNIGHPTFKERVEFAEKMASLAVDPKYSHLHNTDEEVKTPTPIIPTTIGPKEENN